MSSTKGSVDRLSMDSLCWRLFTILTIWTLSFVHCSASNGENCSDVSWVRSLCNPNGEFQTEAMPTQCGTHDGIIANACFHMDDSTPNNLCRLRFIDLYCNDTIYDNGTFLGNQSTLCEREHNCTNAPNLDEMCDWLPNICRKASDYQDIDLPSKQCVSDIRRFCGKWNRVCDGEVDTDDTGDNVACEVCTPLLVPMAISAGVGVAFMLVVILLVIACRSLAVHAQRNEKNDVASNESITMTPISAPTYAIETRGDDSIIIRGATAAAVAAAAENPGSSSNGNNNISDITDTRSNVYLGQCSTATYRTLERIKTKKKAETTDQSYEEIPTDILERRNENCSQNGGNVGYASLAARYSTEHTYDKCGMNTSQEKKQSVPSVHYYLLEQQNNDPPGDCNSLEVRKESVSNDEENIHKRSSISDNSEKL